MKANPRGLSINSASVLMSESVPVIVRVDQPSPTSSQMQSYFALAPLGVRGNSGHVLKKELRNEEYRYAYAEDFLNTLIATQIKVLREQRELTQQKLAELTGTKQAGISRLENVNYSSWKTETLRKIARALGVRLRITFETFGTLLDDGARFSPEDLQRPEFDNDPVFQHQVTKI